MSVSQKPEIESSTRVEYELAYSEFRAYFSTMQPSLLDHMEAFGRLARRLDLCSLPVLVAAWESLYNREVGDEWQNRPSAAFRFRLLKTGVPF